MDHRHSSNEFFLKEIADFLQTSLKPIRENTSHPLYRLRTLNLKSNLILVRYLDEYPLFGSKYLDYIEFKKVLELFQPRFKATADNLNKILEIKSGMNDKRTIFI